MAASPSSRARPSVALLAAVLVAAVGLVGAGSPAGAQAAGVPVRIVHGAPDTLLGEHPTLEVSVDGAVVATVDYGEVADLELPAGTAQVEVEPTDVALSLPIPPATVDLAAGSAYTLVVSGPGTPLAAPAEILVFENDQSSIQTGIGRFTFNHAHMVLGLVGDVDVQFDDEHSLEGISYGDGASIELPEARYDAEIGVAGVASEEAEIPIVGGVHVVATLIHGPDPLGTAQDVQILFLVQELPVPETDVEAFCAVLPALSVLGEEVSAAIAGIGTADELDQDGFRELFGRADELLANGDRSRDLAVDAEWQVATGPLRQARAAFELVDYDLSSPEGQQVAEEIQAAAGGDPDPAGEAATAALTDYFLTTCLAAGPPAEEEPPPAEEPPPPAGPPADPGPTLPRTGAPVPVVLAALVGLGALATRRLHRAAA